MKSFHTIIILFLLLLPLSLFAQQKHANVTILDISARNKETNDARVFSVYHMANIAGFDFEVLDDLELALQSKFVIASSQLLSKTFTSEEKELIKEFVSNGGILLAPKVLDEDLFGLFGIDTIFESTANHLINFNQSLDISLFEYIDEPEEWTISLGRLDIAEIFKSNSYILNSAVSLATYENEESAFIRNQYGFGTTYAFGVSWKDIILRSQINRDYEAQRISSNGFEPTQDVVSLLVRSIYNTHIPYGVWKHTSGGNSTSTLMITHDIDSATGFDTLSKFCESEANMGIIADYNITVRYFKDELMSDFYSKSQASVPDILNNGHVLGSHSVGHFFDFGDDDIFPIGETGNTIENYAPYNDGSFTFGGSVVGECEVSKNKLESDFGQNIRIFRAGHLAYNKYLVNVLDNLGYMYNSSFAANSVLTNFPYRCKYDRSFSGKLSNIYEMAVSISDVFHSNPISKSNYLLKAQTWIDITKKIDANNATTVLLIHPNRGYKLIAQEYYLSHIPSTIAIKEMGEFGDFWRAREKQKFYTKLQNDSLHVIINLEQSEMHESISFIIKDGQELKDVRITDQLGQSLEMQVQAWNETDLIVYKELVIVNQVAEVQDNLDLKIFPNPAIDHINIELELKYDSDLRCEIYTTMGQQVYNSIEKTGSAGRKFVHLDLKNSSLLPGIYYVKINAGRNGETIQRIFIC